MEFELIFENDYSLDIKVSAKGMPERECGINEFEEGRKLWQGTGKDGC